MQILPISCQLAMPAYGDRILGEFSIQLDEFMLNCMLFSQNINHTWYFFAINFTGILESTIMALQKCYSLSQNYILMHHVFIFTALWSIINYFPCGHALFPGVVQATCHFICYIYTLISKNCITKWRPYRSFMVGLSIVSNFNQF